MNQQPYSLSGVSLVAIVLFSVVVGVGLTSAIFFFKNEPRQLRVVQSTSDDESSVETETSMATDETDITESVIFEASYKSEKLYNPSRTAYVYIASEQSSVHGKLVTALDESRLPFFMFNGDTQFAISPSDANIVFVLGTVQADGSTVTERSINDVFFTAKSPTGYVYVDRWIDDTRLLEIARGGDGPGSFESATAIDTSALSRTMVVAQSFFYDDSGEQTKKHVTVDTGATVLHQVCSNDSVTPVCGDIEIFNASPNANTTGFLYTPDDYATMKRVGTFGLGERIGMMSVSVLGEYNASHAGSMLEVVVEGKPKPYIFDLQHQKLLP